MAAENIISDASREYFDQFLRNNSIKEHSDEEPKLCPLCNNPVRFYFINFNEKLLMCGKADCDFPFGYEELQIVRVNAYGEEYRVKLGGGSKAPSTIWTNNFVPPPATEDDAFSETTILYQEVNEIQPKCHDNPDIKESKESTLDTDLKDIEDLNRQYKSIKSDEEIREQRQIRREKWIKKLLQLQEMSGTKLLKPEEINLSKRIEPKLEHGEFIFEIDHGNGMTKVQIRDSNGCCNVDKKEAEEVPEAGPEPSMPVDETVYQDLIVIQDEDPHKFLQPLDINSSDSIRIVIQEEESENLSQAVAANGSDLNISQNMESMIIQTEQSDISLQINADNSCISENVEEGNGQPKQPDIPA